MPDELVEKVARAIYEQRPKLLGPHRDIPGSSIPWERAPQRWRRVSEKQASAAIAAMPRIEALEEALGAMHVFDDVRNDYVSGSKTAADLGAAYADMASKCELAGVKPFAVSKNDRAALQEKNDG